MPQFALRFAIGLGLGVVGTVAQLPVGASSDARAQTQTGQPGKAGQAGKTRPAAKQLGVPWWIYVGTYTGASGNGSKGIYLFEMKTSDDPDIPEFVTMTPR